MKRINKRKKRLLLIGACAAVLILLVILAVWGIRQLVTPKVDTEQGLSYIRAAESEDITTIEQKINQLERQDGGEDSRSYKEKFASSIVMGDSIAEGFSEYDVLNASSVVSKIGVHLYELEEQVQQAADLNPQVIFLALGMNDVIATAGDTEQFLEQYEAVVAQLREAVPNAHIYVNSIFPVQDSAIEKEPELAQISEYNTVLRQMCDDLQLGFIDNTDLVQDQYYEEDGVHFKAEFYPLWADRMAEVAAL
ncbi:MAG TPA: phospholipase [Candidatus Mediterraneibacter faecigallinarum]|jgi:lysophospholipase L1-like esterase|uniref:Phospholipase n=1 Tax=Candidatus Mediterraneibacter faecigallinarum TaxID=2838669 RepID=A0A9D2SXS2_9FIRM|nr:phospholipase [Candidatus Mediterraneibacter faecigallinarum]